MFFAAFFVTIFSYAGPGGPLSPEEYVTANPPANSTDTKPAPPADTKPAPASTTSAATTDTKTAPAAGAANTTFFMKEETPQTPFASCMDEKRGEAAANNIPLANRSRFCKDTERLEGIKGKCSDELEAFRKLEKGKAGKTGKEKYDQAEQQFNNCEDKWNDILNTDYGKGDCKEQVKKKYETKEDASSAEVREASNKNDLQKAAGKAERDLRVCRENKGYSKDNEKCNDVAKDLKEVRKDFNDSCGELGGDTDSCIRSLKSCSECDSPSGDTSAEDVDCVLIRQTGICPELATGFIEDLDKEKEDMEEKIKDLEDKLETLKEDKSRLMAELDDEKLAFEADIEELRTAETEINEELESSLKNIKAETKAAFNSARAKVLAEMDKADQLQFQLSNGIEAAYRTYRDSKNKVYRDCKQKAKEKLSEYRKARKAAISYGRFKQESITQALSENRVTFAQKDDAKFSRYFNTCKKTK